MTKCWIKYGELVYDKDRDVFINEKHHRHCKSYWFFLTILLGEDSYMQKVRTLTWEYVISMHSALLFVFCWSSDSYVVYISQACVYTAICTLHFCLHYLHCHTCAGEASGVLAVFSVIGRAKNSWSNTKSVLPMPDKRSPYGVKSTAASIKCWRQCI